MTKFFLTHRRQIQILADLLHGITPEIDNTYQLDAPFDLLYQTIADALPDDKYFALTRARLRDPEMSAIIDEILSTEAGYRTIYRSMAEIGATLPPIKWLWPGWIPCGYLSLLAARPGAGKSYLALDLSRRIIHKLPAPDGQSFQMENLSDRVIYVDADDFLPGLYERAQAWGMDSTKFFPLQRSPQTLLDMVDPHYQDILTEMVFDLKPALVAVDSLSMVNARGENSVEDLRNVLIFFIETALASQCGFLLIHHLRKPLPGQGEKLVTLHDLRGTGHLSAMARSILALDVPFSGDPNGPRTLRVIKNNFAKIPAPLSMQFSSIDDSDIAHLSYDNVEIQLSPVTELERCAEWLRNVLRDGPRSYADLRRLVAEECGFNETMLQQARKKLANTVIDTVGPRHRGNKWALEE